MGLFGSKKVEITNMAGGEYSNLINKTKDDILQELITSGLEFDYYTGETITQTHTKNAHGAFTKGAATAAFGLVGLAATSGINQETTSELEKIPINLKFKENGILLESAKNVGLMKIPWEEISQCVKSGNLILTSGHELTLKPKYNQFKQLFLKNYAKNHISQLNVDGKNVSYLNDLILQYVELVNERAKGNRDVGWGDAPISLNDSQTHNQIESTPSELVSVKPVFCRECGFKLEEGAVFCGECGTKV